MKVRNNYTTTIGVGSLTILPDAVVELPEKFGDKHPVIAYYISRKWLTEVGNEPSAPVVVPPVNAIVGVPTAGVETGITAVDGKTEETPVDNANTETQEQKPAEVNAKKKKQGGGFMTTLEIFRIMAAEFAETDDTTVQIWIDLTTPLVSRKRFGKMYNQALALLTAHRMKTAGVGTTDDGGNDELGSIGGVGAAFKVASYSIGRNRSNASRSCPERDKEWRICRKCPCNHQK
jgi:hypothetical protein